MLAQFLYQVRVTIEDTGRQLWEGRIVAESPAQAARKAGREHRFTAFPKNLVIEVDHVVKK